MLGQLIRRHISSEWSTAFASSAAAVVSFVTSVVTATFTGFSIAPLDFLVDELFEVLFLDQRFMKFCPVDQNVFFGIVILSQKQFKAFFCFGIFKQLDSSQVVGVLHVSKDFANLVPTVGALNVISKGFSMATNFAYESIPSSLKHQTYAEVRVVFFFLETSFRQLRLKSYIAFLFKSKLVAHSFKHTYLANYKLFLIIQFFF